MPTTTRTDRSLTGGEAIVEALITNGVDTVFGLPGVQMYPFFDALQRHAGTIRTIGARHEQACGYMAFGYARSTGRPGVFAVVPGPGVLNATSALCTARGACMPLLCVTGQVPAQYLDRGRGHLHELPDQLGTLRTLVKWAERIERPADAPAILQEAFRQMLSGRPGPVAVEMSWDVMASRGDVVARPAAVPEPAPIPSPAEIEAAAALLARAERPLIFVGSGAQDAGAEVLALAEALDAPVIGFRGGRGIVPEEHPLGAHCYDGRLLWPDADAVVGIGTRLELPFMRWTGMMNLVDAPAAPPHVVRIDIDAAEMRRLRPHAPIVADAREGTAALLEALRRHGPGARRDRSRIAWAKAEAAQATAGVAPHVGYLAAIRAALPDDGFLVEDLCQTGFASYFAYPVRAPRRYVSSGHQGTLGYGFMTALGVKAANPDKPVVAITGDGGFLFGVGEMATAAQYGLAVITLVFNNGAYGNVLRDQEMGFGGRLIGSELTNPDFPALAAAFGIASARIDSPQALAPVLARAIEADAPMLIEVVVDRASEVSPWPFIHPPL